MTPPRWNLATAWAGVSTPNRVRFSAETVSAVPPVTYGTNSWPTFCSRVIAAIVASICIGRLLRGGGRRRGD